MRILHTSDWHLGKSLEGRDRQQEQIQVLDEICQIADEEQIDLVLIAGDIYQTVNPPAWAENLFYETLHRLSDFGRRGIIVISGNHDQPERIRAANPLADKQAIYLIGLPSDQLAPSIYKRQGQVHTLNAGTGWLELAIPSVDEVAMVSVLPYPSEARLKQLLTASTDIKEIRSAYSEHIGGFFTNHRSIFRKDTVNLAMSHLFIQGGETSESEIEIQVGGAYTVETQHIPEFYQYVALGHLHRAQNVKGTPSLTRYSGSPLAYSFSEANHRKSVTIVEAKANEQAIVKEIPLHSGKPLIQKKIKNGIPELEAWTVTEGAIPSWIDLELYVPNPLSIEEIQRIRKLHDGFINIRLITPELARDIETIDIISREPKEQFERFYIQKTGSQPRKEVIDLFTEIFNLQSEEEANDE